MNKFELGDRVKVPTDTVVPGTSNEVIPSGTTGIVVDGPERGTKGTYYDIQFENYNGQTNRYCLRWWMYEADLVKAE